VPGQFAAANLQAAHDSAMVMSKLLDNVLSLSKIESGKMELQTGSFAIVEQLVREPVSVFARVLARKQLRLRVEVSSKVPRLMLGDVDKLRGVLSNFISNAIKVRHSR
jgi:signal transduction histidine kinase